MIGDQKTKTHNSLVSKDRWVVGSSQPECLKEGDHELLSQHVHALPPFLDQIEEAVRCQGESISCSDGGAETVIVGRPVRLIRKQG